MPPITRAPECLCLALIKTSQGYLAVKNSLIDTFHRDVFPDPEPRSRAKILTGNNAAQEAMRWRIPRFSLNHCCSNRSRWNLGCLSRLATTEHS
jgi:hypothetical protein